MFNVIVRFSNLFDVTHSVALVEEMERNSGGERFLKQRELFQHLHKRGKVQERKGVNLKWQGEITDGEERDANYITNVLWHRPQIL